MALPVAVYEIRSTATAGNVNGAGFNSARGGTDYTLQDAAQLTATDYSSVGASTTLTSATGGFTAAMVGNFYHQTTTGTGGFGVVGWYEIVTFTDANNVVLDRTPNSGTASVACTGYVGGAGNLGALDDAFFEILIAGSTVYIQNATYTLSGAVSIAKDGSSALPMEIIGYNTTRGDTPTGATRPTIAAGANIFTVSGNYYNFSNIIFTGTSTTVVQFGSDGNPCGNLIKNCKITNSSVTASRNALWMGVGGGGSGRAIGNELISTAGRGVAFDASSNVAIGNYIHDCGQYGIVGTATSTSADHKITFNIIDTCLTAAIHLATGSNDNIVMNNTLYGAETPTGIGINIAATTGVRLIAMNNIIYGFTTGINSAAQVNSNYYDFNNIYNCTTPLSSVTAGANDIALDPAFVDAPNGDFRVGANMKAVGFPGVFPGGLSIGYTDIGAVQRVEPASAAIYVESNTSQILTKTKSVAY